MRAGWIVAVCALATPLFACAPEPEGKPILRADMDGSDSNGEGEAAETVEASATAPASSRKSACRTATFEGARFTHCIADPARHRIATDLGPDGRAPYRSLATLAASRAADAPLVAFAVNGGMFDREGDPIGYYVESGKRLEELNRADGPGNFHLKPNGVFFGTGNRWQVREAESFYRNVGDRPAFGTQSGPMLVIDGKLHPEFSQDGPSKAVRNGVGVDGEGRAHFVISDGAVSFGHFARYFRDKAKTRNALFLDGNVSALWDPVAGRLDSGAALGPLLVVEERSQ